jgi:hypothetical protein
VEKWLIEVESMMKKSLAYAIDTSMGDYLKVHIHIHILIHILIYTYTYTYTHNNIHSH